MKRITLLLVSIFILHISCQAQSVINKFLNQKFVLNDSTKNADGNFYGAESYRFKKGNILMIATHGKLDDKPISTSVIITGVDEKNQQVVPEVKYHSDFKNKTEDVFLFTAAGTYIIYFFNKQPGEKGEITNNMGLGLTSWIDSGQVFRPGNNTLFALALGKVLGHAIFQFNLMSGAREHHHYKQLVELPGADVADKNGIYFGEKHLDKNLQPHESMYSRLFFRRSQFSKNIAGRRL